MKQKRILSTKQKLVGSGSLLLVGVLFGLSGVMAKYLSESLNAYQVVEYRFGIALLAALIVAGVMRKSISLGAFNKKTLALFAVSFPVSVVLFTLAIFNTSVALAVFSFYIATLVSSFVIGRVFFGERIHVYKQIALVLVLVAVGVFTDPLSTSVVDIGFLFGLLSGVVQGIASAFQKKLSASSDRLSLLTVQTLSGVVLAVLILVATGEPLFVQLSGFAWLVALLFGVSLLAISYLFLVGFRHTNLNTGSILVASELVFGPIFALMLLGEGLDMSVLIGGGLTVIAAVCAHIPESRKKVAV